MIINERITEEVRKIAQQPQNAESAVLVVSLMDSSLSDIDKMGVQIPRSSHLGNDYPSNQAFINIVQGAYFNLYDRTTGIDTNYFPWMIKKAGEQHIVADNASRDTLVPFFQPNGTFFEQLDSLPSELQRARTPAQLHYLSQKLLHPDTVTYSQWVLQNREAIQTISDLAGQHFPLFDRYINGDGLITKPPYVPHSSTGDRIMETAEVLAEAVSEGNPVPKPGIFLHANDFNVYLDMAIDAAKPENRRIFNDEEWGVVLHGAGPDMIRYATGKWDILSKLHNHITSQLPELGLPKKIFFGLVPTAEMKLALPERSKADLDELIALLKRKEENRQALKAAETEEDKQKQLDVRYEIRDRTKEVIFGSDIANIGLGDRFSTHYSHYDVFSGGPIYFPDALRSVTFRQIKELNNDLKQIK